MAKERKTPMKECPYKEPCYMRADSVLFGKKVCMALDDVKFKDGMCHFRKATKNGPNEWDKWRKEHGNID